MTTCLCVVTKWMDCNVGCVIPFMEDAVYSWHTQVKPHTSQYIVFSCAAVIYFILKRI